MAFRVVNTNLRAIINGRLLGLEISFDLIGSHTLIANYLYDTDNGQYEHHKRNIGKSFSIQAALFEGDKMERKFVDADMVLRQVKIMSHVGQATEVRCIYTTLSDEELAIESQLEIYELEALIKNALRKYEYKIDEIVKTIGQISIKNHPN